MREPRPVSVPITIIAIDQKTLDAPNVRPLFFWGDKHARVLRILRKSGASAIGFDLIQPLSLSNPGTDSGDTGKNEPDVDQVEAQEIVATPQLVLALNRNLLPSGKVSETLPNERFRTALAMGGGGLGFDNTTPDPDGVIRSFTPIDSDGSPSFALEVARIATSQEPKIKKGDLWLGSQQVHLDGEGRCLINYVGPDMTFPRISYSDLLASPQSYQKLIKNHICLIGTTSYELQDYHAVPFFSTKGYAGQLMAGVETNANMISTLLSSGIWRSGPAVTWLCLFVTIAVSIPCCISLRIAFVVPGLLVLITLWTVVCVISFEQQGWLLPLVPVVGTLCSNGLLLTVARLRQENAHKKQIENVFGRYVSPLVLNHLMSTSAATELGGRRQTITVLFSDIRGFTARSEQMEPEEVTRFLNFYLEKMVDVVFAHGGTIDKYMGDGIMAVWNWPYEQTDHALRAVRAAVQMQEEVAGAGKIWQDMGFSTLSIGIGIHSGSAVLGNIGSPQRMESTAIGDTVNTASRLESLTKDLGQTVDSRIIVSEAVLGAVQEAIPGGNQASLEFGFFPMGDTAIRGRKETINLYAIISKKLK